MDQKKASSPALVAISVLLFFALSACSSDQEVHLMNDGSGHTRVEIELHPFFVQYLRDLTAGLGEQLQDEEAFRVFDEYRIASSFNRIEGLLLEDFERLGPGHIVIVASFTDPSGVVPPPADPKVRPVISLTHGGGGSHTLLLNLTPANIDSLYGLLGVEEQQNMLTFGPQADPLSEDEYTEMMTYALGTYAKQKELNRILRSRKVDITFQV